VKSGKRSEFSVQRSAFSVNCELQTLNAQRSTLNHFRHDGAALILAIFACVILTVLAVGLAEVVRVEVIAARSGLDGLQARYLAKAGFNLARSVLMYQDEEEVDGPQDVWFTLRDEPPLQLGDGSASLTTRGWCRMAVIDACSLININTASEEVFSGIIGDPVIAQGIVAHREEKGPFGSLGELAQVKGMEEERLADLARFLTVESLERNVSASGRRRININAASAEELARGLGLSLRQARQILRYRATLPDGKFQSAGELLRVPLERSVVKEIIDRASLSDDEYIAGRVNLNTAPREVLLALPGSSPEFVEALLARRQEKDGALHSSGDLFDFPMLSEEDLVSFAGLACTKSSTFIIEAWAGLEGKPVRRALQGLVMRQPGPIAPIISGWRETAQPQFIPIETGT